MKKVLINTDFRDRYTGKIHKAGKTEEMTESRGAEIKEVNPELVTVIGDIPEDEKPDDGKANKSGDDGKSATK